MGKYNRKKLLIEIARFLGVFIVALVLVTYVQIFIQKSQILDKITTDAKATYQYAATGGTLVTGTEQTVDNANVGSWRGTLGNDTNYWSTARHITNGLDKQLQFDNVELNGSNKMQIVIEDSNTTTGNAYAHQICDWVSSTDVDVAAGGNCTTGGWRTLHPRKTDIVVTSDTTNHYEIFDGYFWDTTTAPGTVVSTPLTNFINTGSNNRVLIRIYSTVASTVVHKIDLAFIEVGIDPVYEPADFVKTSGGTITGNITDLIGPAASDANKLTIPQASNSTPLDVYFKFTNVQPFTGANTILVSPESAVSNVALTIGTYLRRFSDNTWVQIGSNYGTASDQDYISTFNSTTISGFDINDYISGTDEVWVRFYSNAANPVRNLLIDRFYIMIGAVNTDSGTCETSWGTTNSTTCANTRDLINDNSVGTASNSTTWQTTSVIEYPAGYYPLDNDDDAVNSEYAASNNLSFPVTLASNTSVTAVHYAARYRPNTTTETADLQARAYQVSNTNNNYPVGSGWVNTPGTDTNATATYGYYDTWRLAEIARDPEDYINTSENRMNLRLRTSASTNVTAGVTRDWDFAMMSIRYVNEPSRRTLNPVFFPTGGSLVTGAEVTVDASNVGSWRATLGNDSTTNGSGNYWTTSRNNPNGLDKQLQFDHVKLYGANKLIITIEDSNITTADAYVHQICDWTTATSVDVAAAGNCTTGGWRTLNPRKANNTNTSDTTRVYEIYDGYFQDRTTTPGTFVTTPLTNFINSSNNERVLIRAYSTVASTVQHRLDFAVVESAIDPVYEPAGFTKTAGGTTTNFVSDAYGSIGSSDNTKFTVPMSAISTAADVYFVFKNVDPYTGANTVLADYELIVSNAGLSVGVYLRNFNTNTWTQIGSNLSPTADTEYASTFNSTTIGSFSLADYISGSNEIWLRFATNTPGTVYNFSLDRLYIMLGSVNTDSGLCETSWGTTNSTTCTNTRDLTNDNTAASATANTTTWQATSVIEYPSGYHPLDNDDDTTASEYAFSQNLSFPLTIPSGSSVTGIHYAGRYRSNVATTITVDLQVKTYQSATGYAGEGTGSGWQNTPQTDTNAATNYNYYDSFRLNEIQENPDDYVDSLNNLGNLRLRTSASTNVAGGVTRDWDFAMMSIRYVENVVVISVSVSDGTIAYGNVTNGASKNTLPSQLNDLQTITNDSNVAVDFNIKGQNSACPWTLSSTSGNDQYVHEFSVNTNDSWWNDLWGYRRKITFDNASQSENLTNFPVMVKLNSSRIDYTNVQNDYDDLRFIDTDGTELNYEVETWNEAGDSYIWVNVPQINGSSATDYIYMYYGNINATPVESISSTWASSYKGIWHLNQDPSGTAPQIKNSVGNTSDGTSNGTMVTGDSITGKVHKGLHTDGTDDYINVPNTAALDINGPFSLSFWFNPTTTVDTGLASYKGIMSKAFSNTDADNDWTVFWEISDAGKLRFGSYGDNVKTTTDTWTSGTWYNVSVSVDSSNNAYIYVNGTQDNFGGDTSISGNAINGSQAGDIKLGLAKIASGDQHFDGKLDEVRISNVARSANWVAASYMSEIDTFNTFGSEQTYVSPTWTDLTTSYQTLATNVAVSGTKKLDLQVTTPNPNSCNNQQNVDVTVQAVEF